MFVDDIGDIVDPNLVTNRFRKILQKNNLKHIRFHDLRHSCASLLVASKIPMKNIQEWLGHSNFSTTADVYSQLDYTTKYESANAINQALTQNKEEKSLEEEKAKSREELENEISRLQELIKEQEEQERIEKEREEKRKQKIREQAEM